MPRWEGRSRVFRYGGALLCVVTALGIREAFPGFLDRFPYLTAYLSILIVARYFGRGATLLALASAAAGSALLNPAHDWQRLVLFVAVSTGFIWVAIALGGAREVAERNADLARERLAQLEKESALSAQLRAIVESSNDAIISKDLDGVIRSWNQAAERTFGYPADEAIGKSILLLVPKDRAHEESGVMERIRKGDRIELFETVRVRKDGREIHVSLTVSPIRDAQGRIIGASHIARDITERKEFEEQLRQTQRLESVGVLAGGLAHDFNNLLTGIMGNASLALDELGDSQRARPRLGEVLKAGERAALLIRQMLAYAGKGRVVIERLDLSEQVREILPLLRTSISKLVEIEMNLASNLPAIEADRSQIQQLIMNLALNGAEAIEDRLGKVTISTSLRAIDGQRHVVLEVTDTGGGMTEDVKARIFDPFFTTKFTGRGLGLAAVMGIIRAHHGAISVASTPGRGSTFTVSLPPAFGDVVKTAPAPLEAQLHGTGLILVADDEDLIRNMARLTLEHCGYQVEVARDGQEALDRFGVRSAEYSAVLLDLTMPAIHGKDVLRAMREIRADLPVVLSSGYTEVEAMSWFAELQPAAFLQKPYTATELARKIARAIREAAPRGSTSA